MDTVPILPTRTQADPGPDLDTVLHWLRTPLNERAAIYQRADQTRREWKGDGVHLRGIVEFSNVCANDCLYCGLRRSHRELRRYRMKEEEIVALASRMPDDGVTTIVLQSGEAPSRENDRELGRWIARIKRDTNLAVTVSVGERPREVYAYWRECGMDRYLLRFETSNPVLFERLHPDSHWSDRLRCLEHLRELGVQVGSGFMIGLPGETLETLAQNILLCRTLDLDMVGIGPFLPHPATPLGQCRNAYADDPDIFWLAIAVLRMVHPRAHIPATTAYDAVAPGGRDRALQCGANIFMPNYTPREYRRAYLLYPNKPCVDEEPGECARSVAVRLRLIGRHIARGPGHASRVPVCDTLSRRVPGDAHS